MKFILHVVAGWLLLTAAAPGDAQEVRGRWTGVLEVNDSVSLPLVVNVTAGDGGTLLGTIDSPTQGTMGMPLANIVARGGSFSFDVPQVAGRYEGRWEPETSRWNGRWSQSGMTWPLLLASAPAPTARPPLPAHWQVPDDARIGSLLERSLAGRASPGVGLVVGVIEGDRRRFVARGPAAGRAFDRHTLFEIGSMSKVFTAALLTAAVRRGELALDDPAARLLPPGARLPERDGRAITLAHLASHRSALPRIPDNLSSYQLVDPYADYDEARLLDFLRRYSLPRDPGLQFEYSNLGMGLLGYLLARSAGTSYDELVRRVIAAPLGMDDTAVALSADQQSRFAQGHDLQLRPAGPWRFDALAGAGALRSTADDLLAFLEAAMGSAPADLAAAMRDMLAPRWPGPSPQIEMALGWMVLRGPAGPIYFHEGGTNGFRTVMAFDPARRRGLVVLTNAAADPSPGGLALHLLVGAPLALSPPTAVEPPAQR